MKILTGQFKGKNFYMPAGIRPTQNIVREAVFDILGHDLAGLEFLDLFAGSGAVGLEAVSLGAKRVTLVEKDLKCSEIILTNITLLGNNRYDKSSTAIEVLNSDVFATIKSFALKKRKFDIVFIDPPYGRSLGKKALKALNTYDILQPNCTVVIQRDSKEILPKQEGRILLFREKKYGSTFLDIYRLLDESKE